MTIVRLIRLLLAYARGNRVYFSAGANRFAFFAVSFDSSARNNIIQFGKAFKKGKLKIRVQGDGNRLEIGDDVRLGGKIFLGGRGKVLKVGSRCHIVNVYLVANKANMTIGAHCLVSHEVEIRNSDVHHLFNIGSEGKLNHPEDVVIGEHVWLGARSFVSKGVTIADGSVVGACSFVNKAFSEGNCVIAGTPAKVCKRGIHWKR